MISDSYRPVHTVCLHPEHFPQVDLYMLNGYSMVLYKPGNQTVVRTDMERLRENQVQYLYVTKKDAATVADFLEQGLEPLLKEENLSDQVKGLLLLQVGINYLMDIFEMPDRLSDKGRYRRIVAHLTRYILSRKNAISHLHGAISHDYYTFAHSVHVAALSIFIHAELFKTSEWELNQIGIGGILHDIGMIFVPKGILQKSGILTDFEYSLIKKHAELGYECLSNMGGFSNLTLAAVRYHHERHNGEGYPFSLSGEDIPRTAQVTAICDVFSALTSDRTYKKAVPPAEAIQLMEEASENIFNRQLLRRFKRLILAMEQE